MSQSLNHIMRHKTAPIINQAFPQPRALYALTPKDKQKQLIQRLISRTSTIF